ncbi:hypothetical protein HN803_07545 [candidate division WWE3 bacterium]|nr:hypothetical protein [candidate division WWE3 bacterium]
MRTISVLDEKRKDDGVVTSFHQLRKRFNDATPIAGTNPQLYEIPRNDHVPERYSGLVIKTKSYELPIIKIPYGKKKYYFVPIDALPHSISIECTLEEYENMTEGIDCIFKRAAYEYSEVNDPYYKKPI